MKKLTELYLHMIYEQQGKLAFDLKKYEECLRNAVIFKNGSIVSEDKDLLIDVPDELFNYCYDHQEEIIRFEKIEELLKESKHYHNLMKNNQQALCFFMINFNDDLQIDSYHHKVFKIDDDHTFEYARKLFRQTAKESDGFVSEYDGICFCVVNKEAAMIEDTIYHELSHYLQKILNIRKTSSTFFDIDKHDENNDRFQKLKKLGLTLDKLNYYFNDLEYSVHVDQLSKGLLRTYLKSYNDLSIFEFIALVHDQLGSEDFIKSEFLKNYGNANGNDITPLMMYAGAKVFNHKWQKIQDGVNRFLLRKTNGH